MDCNPTVVSEDDRCITVSQTITSDPLGITCYIGGLSLDTELRPALSTGELTARNPTNRENKKEDSGFVSQSGNSISGTYEGTQLKARLA